MKLIMAGNTCFFPVQGAGSPDYFPPKPGDSLITGQFTVFLSLSPPHSAEGNRASTGCHTASETTRPRSQSRPFSARPATVTLSHPPLVGEAYPVKRITAISRSGSVTIRTRLSSGSGVSSRVFPAGITNDIDVASETTGEVIGIFCEVITGAVIGILSRGFITTGDVGKEQVETGIVL